MSTFDTIDTISVYEYDYNKKYTHVEGFLIDSRLSSWFEWLHKTKLKPTQDMQTLVGDTFCTVKTDMYWENYQIVLWFSFGFILFGSFIGIVGLFLKLSIIEVYFMVKEEFSKEVNWYWWLGVIASIFEFWIWVFLIIFFFVTMYLLYKFLLYFTWNILHIPHHRFDNRIGYVFFPLWTVFWLPRLYIFMRKFNRFSSISDVSFNHIRWEGFYSSLKIKSDSKQKEIYFWENWKYNNNNTNTDYEYHIWMVEEGYTRFDPFIYDPGNFVLNTNLVESSNLIMNDTSYARYGEGFYINKVSGSFLLDMFEKKLQLDTTSRTWSWAFINQYHLHPVIHENNEEINNNLLFFLLKDTNTNLDLMRIAPNNVYTNLDVYNSKYNNKDLNSESFVSFLSVGEIFNWYNTNNKAKILSAYYWLWFDRITFNSKIILRIKHKLKAWREQFIARAQYDDSVNEDPWK